MELMDVIRNRRSIRKYKPDPVPEDEIKYILEAARLAPSWANTQCWHFVVVTDPEVKGKIGEAGFRWSARGPAMIVACADPAQSGFREDQYYYLVDIGIALEHLVLAAVNRGLGTCWVVGFNEAKVKEALGAPENMRVVALTPLGYPAEEPAARGRKSLEQIFSYNRFEQKSAG
jgi:nitroreductase